MFLPENSKLKLKKLLKGVVNDQKKRLEQADD